MRLLVCILYFLLTTSPLFSQTLKSGNYVSSDRFYSVSVEQKPGEIILTEPNKVNTYTLRSNGFYYHTEEKYQTYYIRPAGDDKFYSGKSGAPEHLFTYSAMNEMNTQGLDDCPIYDKYVEKTEEDPDNVQAWAFCGAVAMAKCTMTEAGVKEFLRSAVIGLKSIAVNPGVCPCTDAITPAEWTAYNP